MLIDKPRFPIREMILHGWWPSFLKKALYRLKGYQIGHRVRLAFGAVIVANKVSIGDYASVGFFTFIRGNVIRIGRHVQIGAGAMLDTPHLDLGDGTKINEQVFVGGLGYPDSKLIVGRNCQIMQMTFINPTRTIEIGDDTGIGGDSLLFGHTSWLSQFEGYPVDFSSIKIGNSVSIAWRVFVLPGTEIADGAVIGANSLVRGKIPPRCLAVGFPARVVSREPDFPRPVSPEEKVTLLQRILGELCEFLRADGFEAHAAKDSLVVRHSGRGGQPKRSCRMQVNTEPLGESLAVGSGADTFLSLTRIPRSIRTTLNQCGVMWLDVEAKERSDQGSDLGEEAAQHFRRYGVRFFRVQADNT